MSYITARHSQHTDMDNIVITMMITTVLIGSVMSHCFYGTTGACQFTCHCKNKVPCVKGPSETSGSCPDGCAIDFADGGIWRHQGCQTGTKLCGSYSVAWMTCNYVNNVN